MHRYWIALALTCLPLSAFAQRDLPPTVPILEETFAEGLNRFDGRSGLWSTLPRRGQLMTNAAEAVFLDKNVLPDVPDDALPEVIRLTDDGLALHSAPLSGPVLKAAQAYLTATGQARHAEAIKYATGQINTSQTWSQRYGYFEIEARIPRGQARWPAFWLTFAGIGWPPEIDIFEAYGAGFDGPTGKDDKFHTSIHFDAVDADGQKTQSVAVENPFAKTAEGRTAQVRPRGKTEVHTFAYQHDARTELQANIYDAFHTYAALWTPTEVIFYFGKDSSSLTEIFRTPTPPDLNDPMYLIANDQFTARSGFRPAKENELDRIFLPDNAFVIRRITMRALAPEVTLQMAAGQTPYDPRGTAILDTSGDDRIVPGAGFDMITLQGGADQIYLTRGRDNKIIAGFGPDDRLTLEGYPFEDAADALSRLTQVGEDVWLPSGADPAWPHTVIFRNSRVADFTPAQFDVRWSVARDLWLSDARRTAKAQTDTDADGRLTSDIPGAWFNDEGQPVAMTGTALSDRFLVGHAGSTVTENAKGGLDTYITWVESALPAHVEHGIARGKSMILQGSSGPDRLEAEGTRIQLDGGDGNDLYIIGPTAKAISVRIAAGGGHDRLRGFGDGHRIALTQELRRTRANWTLTDLSEGVLIRFSAEQSLLIEQTTQAEVTKILGLQ